MDHSPMAVSDEASRISPDSELAPAAKPGGGRGKGKTKPESESSPSTSADLSATETRSTTATIWPNGGGMLDLDDFNDSSTLDDNLKATLVVPNRAVSEPVEITMTVHGNYLSDLVIAFKPGGLVFAKDAELRVQLGQTLVDVDVNTLQVWHEYSDGTVEKTEVTALKTYKNGWTYLTVAVSGFSRYGLRGS